MLVNIGYKKCQLKDLTKSKITLNPNIIAHNASNSHRLIPNFKVPKIEGTLPKINITRLTSQIPTTHLPHSLLGLLTTLETPRNFHHFPNFDL